MAALSADESTQAWWKLTDPCQQPLPTAGPGERWVEATEVYRLREQS
jgi:L-rhamnose mutarotase